MRCPHCGAGGAEGALECGGCGLIFAKWRPKPAAPPPSRGRGWVWVLAAVLVGAGLSFARRRPAVESPKRPSLVTELDEPSFDEFVLRSPVPVLVMFHTPSCEGCRVAEPVLESMAEAAVGAYRVAMVDKGLCPGLGARFNVLGVPDFLFFKNGSVAFRSAGASGDQNGPREDKIREHLGTVLDKVLGKAPGVVVVQYGGQTVLVKTDGRIPEEEVRRQVLEGMAQAAR